MTHDKPKDPGLPPALANALAALSAEHRSLQVLDQIFTDDPDGMALPADEDAADAAMGARLAARTQAHANNVQRTLRMGIGVATGQSPPAREACRVSNEARSLADHDGGDAATDGVVADRAEEVDTGKLLAIAQARRERSDTRPG